MLLVGLLAITVAIVIFVLALLSGVLWGRQKNLASKDDAPPTR